MPKKKSARVYGGVAPDDRKAERRRRLEEAIVEVVVSEGWAAATVRNVSARAGVGARFFYESFADTDDLLVTVYNAIWTGLLNEAVTALAGAPREVYARAHAAVEAIVKTIAADTRRGRFLLSDAPAIVDSRRKFVREAASRLVEQTVEVGAKLDARSAELCAVVVIAGATELIRGWLDGTLTVDAPEIAAVVASTLSNLTTRVAQPIEPAGASPTSIHGPPKRRSSSRRMT